MRDAKSSFSPVVIKQEPRDLSDQDATSPAALSNNGYNNHLHHFQESAVDLRSTPAQRQSPAALMTGRVAAAPAAPSEPRSRYDANQDFVAEIARRVREENGLRSLELTPVTGLGPLSDLKLSGLGQMTELHGSGLGHLSDLKASGLALFPGISSSTAEGRGKSRGEYACGECSSRFDTARDYRAHCLTHQVLMAESRLRTTRGGAGRGEEEGLGEGEEERSVFGGLGTGVEGASFTCEDCDTRFSSRDTYAMHMLIRAKNEACFPRRPLNATAAAAAVSSGSTINSSISTTTTTTTTPTATNKTESNADMGNPTVAPPSPTSSLTGGTPLAVPPASALLLAANTPPELKHEPVARSDVSSSSGRRSEGGRHSVTAEAPHHVINSLGVEVGRMTSDYGSAWWSKYMPWMTGAGLVGGAGGGAGGEGEGPSLPMVCYICGELFSNRDSLAMHVLFHTRDTPAPTQDAASSSSSSSSSAAPLAASTAWRKPLPSLPSPMAMSSVPPSAVLLMGHAAMRQLQQRGHYSHSHSHSHNPASANFNHRQSQLSPTEAAVASAAAAAVAAVTPPQSSGAQTSPKAPSGSGNATAAALHSKGPRGGASEVNDHTARSERLGVRLMDCSAGSEVEGSVVVTPAAGSGLSQLSLPRRGASAPLLATTPTPSTPTTPSASPLAAGSSSSKDLFRSAGNVNSKGLDRSRPLSADHVTLRHRPLLASTYSTERRHSDDLTPSFGHWKDAGKDSANNGDGWRNGSDSHAQHGSAFSLYRLQRYKKLRLAKGVYRRPGARGRPPMTIYGTARRRPAGGHVPTLSASVALTADCSQVVSSPSSSSFSSSAPSSSTSSSRIGHMVQALASQGHEVSACIHCELLFGDRTLYQLHMGLHNVNNPWQCNACGYVCSSRLHFATHTLHY